MAYPVGFSKQFDILKFNVFGTGTPILIKTISSHLNKSFNSRLNIYWEEYKTGKSQYSGSKTRTLSTFKRWAELGALQVLPVIPTVTLMIA